ncbi:zinc finger BED domain-containing protein DAYSLEEPER-like [Nicotiana tomentosiformis]|uniref:zinc finger BED domain-containing protein DAYSLEEPER-like n=1 Tax=Nicotiana tomentosiformis TaxID=4098 RepID=UPI00388C649D
MINGIGRCLCEWKINKIFTVTVDNASSNDVTIKELSNQLTKIGTNLMNGELLSSDWENVKRIIKFLEIFYLPTLKISESRYVALNIHFLKICAVAVYLKQLIANEDTVLSEMAKKMKKKFNKYWGDTGKMNKIIFMSYILDPRYKLESVGYALVKMFGEDPGATIQAEVKKCMTSLFSEYEKSSSKGVVLASSSDCSLLDTSTSGLSGSQILKNSDLSMLLQFPLSLSLLSIWRRSLVVVACDSLISALDWKPLVSNESFEEFSNLYLQTKFSKQRNGVTFEVMVKGKQDGKVASAGKQVKIYLIAKLRGDKNVVKEFEHWH